MIEYLRPGPEYKPYDGPRWVKGAGTQARAYWQNAAWECVRTENKGRVQHWRNLDDDRTARVEVTPNDPRYPKDKTEEELKADRDRARKNKYYKPYQT